MYIYRSASTRSAIGQPESCGAQQRSTHTLRSPSILPQQTRGAPLVCSSKASSKARQQRAVRCWSTVVKLVVKLDSKRAARRRSALRGQFFRSQIWAASDSK